MTECEPVDAQVTANHGLEARSDLELIAAINNGDSAAFEVLYFRYRDWVAALAFRLSGDNDAALDVMQETFIYVLKKFPGFRLTANFKTFLYPAVRNLSIAARRKAARYQATPGELEQLEDVPTAPVGTAEADDLRSVLACLPVEQREVVLLRFLDGLSLNEVADAMHIPVGTVKSRLHNALQSLRQDERTRDFFER
jgi:RNA polymerase sigma-70 factor (ECF subfamily)